MNQRYLWTIVTLFLAVLGIPDLGLAQTTIGSTIDFQKLPVNDAVKVGEYQSSAGKPTLGAVITEIYPHTIQGRQAATLFVRKIPVLTFLGSNPTSQGDRKTGEFVKTGAVRSPTLIANNSSQIGNIGNIIAGSNEVSSATNDPVQRAGVVASRINQLILDNENASQITVSWQPGAKFSPNNPAHSRNSSRSQSLGDRYKVKINGQELVELNEDTRLADATKNLSVDALQATNRLRRLIGNAAPIQEIADLPLQKSLSILKLPEKIALGSLSINFKGIASWYGYDGSSSSTASGERYNPEALTAAHRSLPLGTKVRVTNTSNGRSVVVRINDRGPYIGGRIIDLSAAAARLLGMMGSGIAPVHIEIVGR